MPELPEVEIVKNFLARKIEGGKVSEVAIFNHKLRYPIPDGLENISGATVVKLERSAKYIKIFLDNEQLLIVHLGMTGRMLIYDHHYTPCKHDHLIFYFDNNITLVYNDPRKFGFIDLIEVSDLPQYKLFKSLGIEPLSDQLDVDKLSQLLSGSRLCIKKFLMNSNYIVGIGNIYASEILFLTKIHPLQICTQIPAPKIEELLTNIKLVLKNAIYLGGSSIKNFVNPEGDKGNFGGAFQVYGRHKQACYNCQNMIEKLIIQQRSTFFCSNCQVL
jgi:formamidopyrimidine-DNA glycosylase